MAEVEFYYKGQKINIQCELNEKIKEIIKRFSNKAEGNIDDIFFMYGGQRLNEELTFNEAANEGDIERKKMCVLADVFQNNTAFSSLKMAKYIICPKCQESSRISIKDYKISLYDCKNGHKEDNILFNELEKTQYLDESKILCNNCNNNKNIAYKNEFFICTLCKVNLCPLCKIKHDNSHDIIDYEQKSSICLIHNDSYFAYCKNCKKDICLTCQKEHNAHKFITYGDILPDKKKINEEFNNFKKIIENFNKDINELILKLNCLMENIHIYLKIYRNLLDNYKNINRNYQILENINDLNSYNKLIIQNISKIINDKNIKNKFNNMIDILNMMTTKDIHNSFEVKERKKVDKNITKDIIKDDKTYKQNKNKDTVNDNKKKEILKDKKDKIDNKIKEITSSPEILTSKKILDEFKNICRNPIGNVGLTVGLYDENDMFKWTASLLGAKDSPYKGGLFYLRIDFPKNYPEKPPIVCFKTPIYHLNVNKYYSDKYGVNPLGFVYFSPITWWKTSYTARDVLGKLFSIFYLANPDSPSGGGIEGADEYINNRDLYEKKAKYFTKKYAYPGVASNNYQFWDFSVNEEEINKINNETKNLSQNYKINQLSQIKEEKAISIKIIFEIFDENRNYKREIECFDNELTEDVIKKIGIEPNNKDLLIIFNSEKIPLNLTLKENKVRNGSSITIIKDVIFF